MPNLYPTFDMPLTVERQEQLKPEYKKSYLFDFEKGDFVRDGTGKVVVADGYTAWVQWCVKTVHTQRFAHLSYSWDYGVEIQEALRHPSDKIIEAEIKRTITEALTVDPRTEVVRDFAFDWDGDQTLVGFTVIPVIGEPVRIEGVKYSA